MIFFRELGESVLIAMRAIRANKMRSVLTTLGIIIGIVAVTGMATAINSLGEAFEKSAKAFGTDVFYVQKFGWVSDEDWSIVRNRPDIKTAYAEVIDRKTKLSRAVAPVVGSQGKITRGTDIFENAFITGTTHRYNDAAGNTDLDGRFFSAEESDGGRNVCVLGADIAEKVFPIGDPIGQQVRINGAPYTVLGVYEKQGGMWGRFTTDQRAFIPLKAFEGRWGSRRWATINVRVSDIRDMENARLELEGIMRQIRRLQPGEPNNFHINASEVLTSFFGQITMTVGIIGLVITLMSLMVGSIGIMNIMFVSVTERTREIGIRKAIGAKRRTILFQFLIEAIGICLIGGLIGLILTLIMVQVTNQVFDLDASMPVTVVFLAIGVSAFVGIVAGILPAYRASKLDPVEALRYE